MEETLTLRWDSDSLHWHIDWLAGEHEHAIMSLSGYAALALIDQGLLTLIEYDEVVRPHLTTSGGGAP